jgi:hypothetical protein
VAGPYNLGNVVTRAALDIDTVHGQISIKTDPLPSIVDGIPLRLKAVELSISKSEFLLNPTVCEAQSILSEVTSGEGALLSESSPNSIEGCGSLAFSPVLKVTPETTQADSPVGITVDLHLPQPNSADVKQAVLTLPAGMALNPSVATGLEACTDSELAAGTNTPVTCPEKSAIGTVEIDTPLLAEALTGKIYVGEPQTGDPYRVFLDADSQKYGISVRLIGTLHADEHTGRLTASFDEAPQIPFTDIFLHFSGGSHAPLVNPQSCGTATTTGTLTASSGATAEPAVSPYTVDGDGSGGECPSSPAFSPVLNATSETSAGGAFDGVTLDFTTADEEQRLGTIAATLPPGLVGMLSSVPLCGEPSAAQGTCPSSSAIGTVTVGAGAGEPLKLPGTVYLTGPYGGAPFGLSIVVGAIAGPYDLGTVVVRAQIQIDPHDAHLTVTSGALPSILQGIPLHIRELALSIDRGAFLVNPTNCRSTALSAALTSAEGAVHGVSDTLPLSGCTGLQFTPGIGAVLGGGKGPAEGASLQVTVSPRAGQANLQSATVVLPDSLPVRLTTLNQACTAATYAADPHACPAASAIGTATAISPVLAGQLSGTVYLVGHGASSSPTLEVALEGDGVTLDLSGTTKIGTSITTTFSSLPDVPLSSFTLALHAGADSVLTASEAPTCASAPSMTTTLIAQNGAGVQESLPIAVSGCAGSHSATVAEGPASWLKIAVVKLVHLRNNMVKLELKLPASGRVTLSARAIATAKASTTRKARTVWVTIKLSGYGRHMLGHHRKLKVKTKLSYIPRTGRRGWVYKTITVT